MPQVSIILPNYNHQDYLAQRIDSVLAQSHSDFELIILDDCSTDKSKEVIDKYRNHPKVAQIVYNDQNTGSTFKQWQKGIALAKGEWIWIAESDDYCEPTFLENLIVGITKHSNCVLAFCQSLMVSDSNLIVDKTNAVQLEEVIPGKEFIKTNMLGNNAVCNASMAIFKKDVFKLIPDTFTGFRYCGDWLFWVQIALQGQVFVSGKYLNYYRRHESNVTSWAVKKGLEFIEGNEVVHFAMNNVELNLREKEIALQKRIKEYLARKSVFENRDVANSVKMSMRKLEPKFQRRLVWLYLIYEISKLKPWLKRFMVGEKV